MNNKTHILQDLAILIVSIAVAVALSQAQFLQVLLSGTGSFSPLQAFIAGMFFTSVFTTAPSIVVLGELSRMNNLPMVAAFGALGALVGDFLIFKFVRDRLGDDLKSLLSAKMSERLAHIIKTKLFRWFSPFAAALVIASPLPDEIAIAMLGMSGARTSFFLPFSFMANLIGILVVGLVARSL